jgi:hypothetical protein
VGVTGNTGVATGCGTSSLSCRVVELTPHHTYTVTVKAINGTVSGPASRPVRVTTG